MDYFDINSAHSFVILPLDLLITIFSELEFNDLQSVFRTNRIWYELKYKKSRLKYWLRSKFTCEWTILEYWIDEILAIKLGYVEVLQYAPNISRPLCMSQLARHAVSFGYLNKRSVIFIDADNKRCASNEDLRRLSIDIAAERGHLAMVMYLYETNIMKCTSRGIDGAASNGHLAVVKYLVENEVRCTTIAIDNAAERGHLEIIKYLIENRMICSTNAIDNAARRGHIAIVEYLIEHGVKCTSHAIHNAVMFGHLSIVDYLNKNGAKCDAPTMNYIARYGRIDALHWFNANKKGMITSRHMVIAAEFGQIEIIRWFLENRPEDYTEDVMNAALRKGRLDIISLLQ